MSIFFLWRHKRTVLGLQRRPTRAGSADRPAAAMTEGGAGCVSCHCEEGEARRGNPYLSATPCRMPIPGPGFRRHKLRIVSLPRIRESSLPPLCLLSKAKHALCFCCERKSARQWRGCGNSGFASSAPGGAKPQSSNQKTINQKLSRNRIPRRRPGR